MGTMAEVRQKRDIDFECRLIIVEFGLVVVELRDMDLNLLKCACYCTVHESLLVKSYDGTVLHSFMSTANQLFGTEFVLKSPIMFSIFKLDSTSSLILLVKLKIHVKMKLQNRVS